MSNVLVTGSLAYDYIMHFGDVFAKHILPEQINILNVSFTANRMSKNFGGTAGNIAYGLKLQEENPIVFTTVGEDFHDYRQWLSSHGVSTEEIRELKEELTASAHIITDENNNQITAFHGGAMLKNKISILPLIEKYDISIAIIAADGKDGMLQHAKELKENNIRYIYDPGHSLPSFGKEEILELLDGSYMLIVNKYEEQLILNKTGLSKEELLSKAEYLIVTLGQDGSEIYHQGNKTFIPIAKTHQASDPTGAGDAYRGGLLKGILNNLPMETCGKLASMSACYAVEQPGTQNYHYQVEEFIQRYVSNYGADSQVEAVFHKSVSV